MLSTKNKYTIFFNLDVKSFVFLAIKHDFAAQYSIEQSRSRLFRSTRLCQGGDTILAMISEARRSSRSRTIS